MRITKRQLRRIIKEASEQAFLDAFDAAYKQPDGTYRGHPDDPAGSRDEEAEKVLSKPSALGDKKYSGTMAFAEQVLNIAPPEVKAYMSIGRNGSVIKRAINRLVHDIARGKKRWYEEVITHEFENMRNQSHFEALGYDALMAWDEDASDMLNWDDLLNLSGYGSEG